VLGLGLVDLVVDAEELVRLDDAVPVIPRLAVERRVGEGMHSLEVTSEADVEEFRARGAVFRSPGGFGRGLI
jgi:hypothetical protein